MLAPDPAPGPGDNGDTALQRVHPTLLPLRFQARSEHRAGTASAELEDRLVCIGGELT